MIRALVIATTADHLYLAIDELKIKLSDEKAKELMKGAFQLRESKLKTQKKYHGKIEKTLSPVLAARWVQVENQIDMLIDLQIASALPLIE